MICFFCGYLPHPVYEVERIKLKIGRNGQLTLVVIFYHHSYDACRVSLRDPTGELEKDVKAPPPPRLYSLIANHQHGAGEKLTKRIIYQKCTGLISYMITERDRITV